MHNIAPIASGIARSGADIISIDGYRGGTGAAPKRIRDNVGIPIELAIAAVDQRLREERIRDRVSVIASGGIRNSSDVVKAIALGADAVSIGTAALCEEYGIVAKAALAQKALPACNIVLVTGEEMKADVAGYAQVLYDADPAAVGGALPDDGFYYLG